MLFHFCSEDNTNFTCDCKTMFEGPFCETTISTTTATTITTTITTTGANESTTAFIGKMNIHICLGDERDSKVKRTKRETEETIIS